MFKFFQSFSCLAFLFLTTYAQTDTLNISLSEAERIFLEKNYILLAQRYSISMAQAAVTQARLLPNPNFSFLGNLVNPNTGSILPFGKVDSDDVANQVYSKNQVVFQVQQLIYLAKKRSKLVAVAESNRQLQSLVFEDLIRTLRYQLYTTYANLYFDFKGYELLQIEENKQEDLVEAIQILFQQVREILMTKKMLSFEEILLENRGCFQFLGDIGDVAIRRNLLGTYRRGGALQ